MLFIIIKHIKPNHASCHRHQTVTTGYHSYLTTATSTAVLSVSSVQRIFLSLFQRTLGPSLNNESMESPTKIQVKRLLPCDFQSKQDWPLYLFRLDFRHTKITYELHCDKYYCIVNLIIARCITVWLTGRNLWTGSVQFGTYMCFANNQFAKPFLID